MDKQNLKLMPGTNTASDDGIHIQHIVRNGLVALVVAIILLSGAALWTVTQLVDFYKNKVNIINEQEHLLHTMRISARERSLLMYAMVAEEDPFVKDDNRMAFYSAGAMFAQARIKFIESPLAENERYLVENQGTLTRSNRPLQDQVVDLVIKDKVKSALKLLKSQVIPEQNKVLQTLELLQVSIDKRNDNIQAKADSISRTSILILLLIVFVIIIGSIYIIRQTTQRAYNLISKLNDTREMLQKTVYELVQQKDALDNHAIVSIADKYGNIIYANDKFCTVSGYSRDELIGHNHRMLKSDMHPREFYQELWSTITQGNVWHGKVCNQRKDGSHYWIASTISPFLDTSGKPYQYVSIRTEITELLEAKIDAEKASRAKSIFMSSMSHELRTPMNAVLGFAQLLEMQLKGEQLIAIQEINKSGKYLLSLINEILDLSQIEAGEVKPLFEEIDIATFLKESLIAIQDMSKTKNITVHLKTEDASEVRLLTDRILLKQALLNYLTNSVKFNHQDGEVVVGIETMDSALCRIYVKDTGQGISEEQLSTIFNPFTKLDNHIGLVEGGGIGLTITKRIIEMMNGNVGVESEEGKGSTFWIDLPVAEQKALMPLHSH